MTAAPGSGKAALSSEKVVFTIDSISIFKMTEFCLRAKKHKCEKSANYDASKLDKLSEMQTIKECFNRALYVQKAYICNSSNEKIFSFY